MRIAITLDDELLRRRFAGRAGPDSRVHFPAGADELLRLVAAGVLDVAVVGVLHRDEPFWPEALRRVAALAPELAIIGVVEPLRPSLDEAVDLARDLSGIAFVDRPDARFDYLARRHRPGAASPSLTPILLTCVQALPLVALGRDFAVLQALRPSVAYGIPEQAAALGAGRRKLERWFQGPDVCSPRRLQSICAVGEAAFLRVAHRLPEREIAGVIGLVSEDGSPNPGAVAREIRSVLGAHRERIREGGIDALADAIAMELRRAEDTGRPPVRWSPDTRYIPARTVLAVATDERLLLVDSSRGLEYALDGFGADAWELLARGATFAELIAELTHSRREGRNLVRARLKAWLGDLLVLELIRREPGRPGAREEA